MSEIRLNRFTDLKAKVKAEMLRRNGTGSVSSYGGTAYDFTDINGKALKEHYEKNVTPLLAVTAEGVPTASGDRAISESELAQMEAKVTYLSAIGKTASSSGCAASCTGLCQSGCNTGCSGCDGCSGCGSGCSGGCSGCGSGCSTGCSGTCKGSCTSCGSGCGDGCSGGCKGGCHSCSGSGCTTSCWSACRSTCTSSGAY